MADVEMPKTEEERTTFFSKVGKRLFAAMLDEFGTHRIDASDVEHIVSSVLADLIIKDGGTYDPSKGSLASYLYVACRNAVLQIITRSKSRHEIPTSPDELAVLEEISSKDDLGELLDAKRILDEARNIEGIASYHEAGSSDRRTLRRRFSTRMQEKFPDLNLAIPLRKSTKKDSK